MLIFNYNLKEAYLLNQVKQTIRKECEKTYKSGVHSKEIFVECLCLEYNKYFEMLNQEDRKVAKRYKGIKNIYIHKINSLMKIMGDSQSSMPCLSKARKNILTESYEQLLLQRKENNKDAARKARLRKKIYMQLLEQAIQNLQKLNEEGKCLEKASVDVIANLKGSNECKQEDEIGQYLIEIDQQRTKKDASQATMDSEKGTELTKILMQIEMLAFPREWTSINLKNIPENPETNRLITKIQGVQQQLPELFLDLRNICSQQNSLMVLSSSAKGQTNMDHYFCKTLMEEYYSKTLCKKDVVNIETHRSLSLLTRMEKYQWRSEQISQSDFLEQK